LEKWWWKMESTKLFRKVNKKLRLNKIHNGARSQSGFSKK
jgi:hypothetical protein